MRRPNVERVKFLIQYFCENNEFEFNIDNKIASVERSIKYNIRKIKLHNNVMFDNVVVSMLPISQNSIDILYKQNIHTCQNILDNLDVLSFLTKDDCMIIKKFVEEQYRIRQLNKLFDKHNDFSTALLIEVVRYVRLSKLKKDPAYNNINIRTSYVDHLVEIVKKSLSLFDWLFISRIEKQEIIYAYNKLEECYLQCQQIHALNNVINEKLEVDAKYAWDVFKRFSTEVVDTIKNVDKNIVQYLEKTIIIDLIKNKPSVSTNQECKQPILTQEIVQENSLITHEHIVDLLAKHPDGLTAIHIKNTLNATMDCVSELLNNHTDIFEINNDFLWKLKETQRSQTNIQQNTEHIHKKTKKQSASNNKILQNDIDLNCDKFAIIDTETNFDDKVFSVGVVVADAKTYELLNAEYYIITNNLNVHGMYTNALWIKHDFETHQCLYNEAMNEIKRTLDSENIKNIFAYNASFDYNHLPDLRSYRWFDIMKIAAYKQYNKHLPQNAEYCNTGRLKRGYTVEDILYYLSKKWKSETHNAVLDAIDELEIMKLLNLSIDQYKDANITAQKQRKSKTNKQKQYITNKKQVEAQINFDINTRVKHKTFGVGIVVSVRPLGNDYIYEVDFGNGNIKKLMGSYANLKNME